MQSYDGLGRVEKKTYPYLTSIGAPDFFIDYTTTAYDKLGRPTSVTKPGNAALTTSYSGNIVNIVDEAGKYRQMAYDALGRLKRVVEDPNGLGYITDYTYDALDKLTQVVQNVGGGTQQTRTFTYDSLGRMLTADNPEDVGSMQYTYDDNGNVSTRTDARSATATTTYDALNRVTQKAYSGAPGASPTVRYCYDGNIYDLTTNNCVAASPAIAHAKGKLTGEGVEDWTATNYTGFDARGRVTASVQRTITSGTTETAYAFSYSYNRDGTLATQTYPSGKVVSFAYDRAGRPVNIAELTGPLTTYVSSVVYADQGAPAEIVFGNSLTEQSCYSARDQMITRRLGTGTQTNCGNPGGDILRLSFGYGPDTANNGNLMQQTVAAPSFSQTQYYGYDGVNRLKAASEGAALAGGSTCLTTESWCREYAYEAFGNRWVSYSNHTLHMATPTSASNFNAATNRLTGTGITYDDAGNLTAHPNLTTGGGGIVYNASNKMTEFTATGVSMSYRYDAKERRVRKSSGDQTTIWVYNAFGQLAAEYATDLTMVQGAYYRTTDHLDSTRIITSHTANVVQRRDFFPFGEIIPANSSYGDRHLVMDDGQGTYNIDSGVKQQFTSQQREDEAGLDYFWARNYSPNLGRFLSVDPQNAGATSSIPQSWNSYGYVNNQPCRYTDPTGMYVPERDRDLTPREQMLLYYGELGMIDVPNHSPLMDEVRRGEQLNYAGSLARSALQQKDCQDLFLFPDAPRWRPDVFLGDLLDDKHVSFTDGFGTVSFDLVWKTQDQFVSAGWGVSSIGYFSAGVSDDGRSYGGNIYLNIDIWAQATPIQRAVVLIHELGHLYYLASEFWGYDGFPPGEGNPPPGGSSILPDIGAPWQSDINTGNVDRACFGGTAFN